MLENIVNVVPLGMKMNGKTRNKYEQIDGSKCQSIA